MALNIFIHKIGLPIYREQWSCGGHLPTITLTQTLPRNYSPTFLSPPNTPIQHSDSQTLQLDDGWPESGGRWSFEDVNISSYKVVIIIAWWNLEDDKIRTVWLDDEDPNVWRQDVVSKYEDLKMKVKM